MPVFGWLVVALACATMTGRVDAGAPSVEAIADAAGRAMAATGAHGLAIAVIDRGRVSSVQAFGARNAAGAPLTPDTVMYGASITKAVFAAFVAQLAAEGRIDLDASIGRYLSRPLPDYGNVEAYGNWGDLAGDERWRRITPRLILNQATGFANYAFLEPDGRLRFHFDPGARYGYSGEGVVLLQFVLEQGMGMDVEAELARRVFHPLGMTSTSLKWRPDFAANLADGWDDAGTARPHDDRSRVRASGSMDTTPRDLARWVAALMGDGAWARAQAEMARPQLPITTASQFPTLQPELPPAARAPHLAAGLGVVAFRGPQGAGFFKGGHDDQTGNMLVCLERARRCVLLMANDVRAERAFPMLVRAALGETGWPWRWEYGPGFSPAGEAPPRS